MPELGLGLGLDRSISAPTPLQLLLKYTSAMWHVPKASGQPFPTLAPRTLPNGVSNVGWTQNVSVNVVLPNTSWQYPAGEFGGDIVGFYRGRISGSAQSVNSIKSETYPTLPNGFYTTKGIMTDNTGAAMVIGVPRSELISEDVNGFVEWLSRNPLTIRYQLAVPIDTLNSPFTNPLIDLKGVVGNQLVDPVEIVLDRHIVPTNGSTSPNTNWVHTGYIKITGDLPIYTVAGVSTSIVGCAFYDINKVYLTGYSTEQMISFGGIIPTPINAKYFRTSFGKTYYSTGNSAIVAESNTQIPYEPYGKANLLLQGFAGTTSSGYVGVLCPNGKTVPFLQFDVTNDYGLASNPSLEILGTSDFGFGRVIKVPSLVTYYPFTKSESSEATTQYGLKVTNTGILSVILEGTTIQLATGLLANTVDAVWVERISGVLKCFINGVEVFSVANTTSLTSRPNFRVGALSTNVGGTTHTGFSNEALGSLVIVKTEVLKARLAWFKFTMQTFGI